VRCEDRLQLEAFVQLADRNQAGVRSDARSLKRDLRKAARRRGLQMQQWLADAVAKYRALGPVFVSRSRRIVPVGWDRWISLSLRT
jgi:hypothetical protein